MKCPVCDDATLVMSERQGIEVDYCPKCRGVWLDRGELDKIIERSTAGGSAPEAPESRPRKRRDDYERRDDDERRHHRPKKKKGFLRDLFEFD